MKKPKKLNERGLVSIIVTIVLIILMTLVVLAMSKNAVREQRQALDRQLSDQAFYNAESGINDWANFLYSNSTIPLIEKTECGNSQIPFAFLASLPPADIDTNNKYTCVLYNKAPTEILVDDLSVADSRTFPIQPNVPINTITFKWRPPTGNVDFQDCSNSDTGVRQQSITDAGSRCNVGGLRIDLVNPGSGTTNRDQLRNNNFVAFLLPNSTARTDVAYGSGIGNAPGTSGQGAVGIGNCDSTGCTVSITGIVIQPTDTYYLHLRSLYVSNRVEVTINNGPTQGRLVGAQYIIDVTGKSADVLRRVKARLPATPQLEIPDYALRTADSVCKLISVNYDAGSATLEQSSAGQRCDAN